jgi:hypothetical protein
VVHAKQQKHQVELIMPDMAGEAILEEIDHPNSYPVIRSLMSRCSAALILMDANRMKEGRHEQEHFAMKLLSFLSELETDGKKGWQDRPVALVLTKADQCENCFDDPSQFVAGHAPGVWKDCQQRFSNHQFFASGVAGACAYRTVIGGIRQRMPLRIEPRGITEPFAWMTEQLSYTGKSKKRR